MTGRDEKTAAIGAPKTRCGGFTLIELVISLVISGIIVMTVNPFFEINVKSYMVARAGKDMLQASRISFNRMAAELRRMQLFDLWDIQSQSLEFVERNPDGTVVGVGLTTVKYTYSATNGQILRNNVRLMEGVSSFNITGYQKDNSTTTLNETLVWKIRIRMVVGADDHTCTLTEEIYPKGLRADEYKLN